MINATKIKKGNIDILLQSGKSNLALAIVLLSLIMLVCEKSNAQSPDWIWAKSVGGLDWQAGLSIAVDKENGDVYTTGIFQHTSDFDPGPGIFNLTAIGISDLFVLKLDSTGHFIWAISIGAISGYCGGQSMTINYSERGNIYITGHFQGSADFDPGPDGFILTSAGTDAFILKLDLDGNMIWADQIGGAHDDYGYNITVDAEGIVYTTGSFWGTADFDPGINTFNLTSAGEFDAYVLKLNEEGELIWAVSMGGPLSEEGFSIELGPEGNIYTSGYFYGTADFDPGEDVFNLTSAGLDNGFVLKMDNDGDFIWAKGIIGYERAGGPALAIDQETGDVYGTGAFFGTFDFDPGPDSFNLTSSGSDWNTYILKWDSFGNFIWVKSLYSDQGIMASSVIRLSPDQDALYIGGVFSENVDFDPGPGEVYLTAANQDIYIVKLDTLGNFIWLARPEGVGNESMGCLVLDPFCNVYATGTFISSSFIFGEDTLSSSSIDLFVAKLKGCTTTVTSINDNGYGSLRDVISCANNGSTISFSLNPFSQITLTSGEIIINKDLIISGPGLNLLTLSGNNATRIFQLLPGKNLIIKNLSMKNAASPIHGGALWAQGNLNLENLEFKNNFENGVPRGFSISSGVSVFIKGIVDIKN